MRYDAIIVGSGMAGLTAGAYLCKNAHNVLIIEKSEKTGGLVTSFERDGFTFDAGIRAFENSGIIFPMLRQLGITVDFIKNPVSLGIERDFIYLKTKESIKDYLELLLKNFPSQAKQIEKIINEIKKVMNYMDVLYGIDNPLFMDLKHDRDYLTKTLLPWMIKYAKNIRKIEMLNMPIKEYLLNFTQNMQLIDTITQHFFADTPAFFALSYFGLYLDYSYPKGGTQTLASKMTSFIRQNSGKILLKTEISQIDSERKKLFSSDSQEFEYNQLIWAADLKNFYRNLNKNSLKNLISNKKSEKTYNEIMNADASESVLTLYLAVDLPKEVFESVFGAHCFYTPQKTGLSHIASLKNSISNTEDLSGYLSKYLELTTYEISCPAIRDNSLAPQGKTGLIISTLLDYDLAKLAEQKGWYEEFKALCKDRIIDVLDKSILKGLKSKVIFGVISSPLTLEKITSNTRGAITGWAFKNNPIPSETRMQSIKRSIFTPLKDIYQAGQWTFSPSGLPISILTGKLAADKVHKKLHKFQR